ncbi:ribonuclease H-like domain-containing protein [Tanacetum coccineum]
MKNDLTKPVSPQYWPKVTESAFAKTHHAIAPGSSRSSLEESYGSNDMIYNYYLGEARKRHKKEIGTLNLGTSINVQKKQSINLNAGTSYNVKKDNLRPCTTTSTEVPTADMIVITSMKELESLFGPLFDECLNGENQVVSNSSADTIADASDKLSAAGIKVNASENGNSFKPVAQTTTNADGTSTSLIPGPVTTEEKAQKKNDVKARSMLLMALPNEHLMTFNQYKDAKTLFAAIQTRFGGNEATKKTQKTLLNTASTQVSTANLSDDTVYAFLASQPNGSQLVYEDLEQIHEDDIEEMDLKWQLALLSMRTRRFFQKTGRKITINGSDTTEYDKSKVECFNCHTIGHFARECRGPRNQDNKNRNQDNSRRTVNMEETSSKATVAIDGAGFDWSYMADDEVPTNMALMAFSDSEVHNDKTCSKTCLKSFETLKTQLDDLRIKFNKSEFNLATYKRGLASVEEQLVFYKKNEVIFCEQLAVLKRDISYNDSEISMLKNELEKLKQEKESNQLKIENFDNASKSLDKLIRSQIPDKSRKGVGFVSYNVVPPPPTGLFSPLKFDLSNSGLEEFQQPEFEGYGPKPSKSFSEDTSNEVRKSPDAPLVEELVSNDKLKKKTVFPTVAKMEFVIPKQQEKPVRKPVKLTAITIKGKGWQKNVNTARPNSAVVNAVRANQGHPQKEDQGYVDSGCSRHMTGNMSYLSDFKEFDEGYVTFGGGAKGGKITGKGTLKTADESQVLLKVPRKNNMYSVDMKNIVPKECLTCLVAKATLDESMLWHRRLGHVNFKTINKLVKENLVRGLPSKQLTLEQSQQGVSNDVLVHKLLSRVLRNIIVIFARTFRVILFSIHNDEWKSFQCHHQTALRMSMLVKDTRSQDGKDDKDNDKGSKSRSQSMKEQAYNIQRRQRPRTLELKRQKQSH